MAKFIADENIPLEVVSSLQKAGLDIISMSVISPGASDEEILSYCYKENKVLITFDRDFSELVFKRKVSTKGIIYLRIHPQSEEYVFSLLMKVLALKIDFSNSFCVAERHRVRVIPFC